MSTPFTKMHGLGNDFVVINALSGNILLNPNHIKRMADRRLGIGFDQLLMIEPGQQNCDFHFRIFNADSSEVEQCGNGLRCVARYLYDQDLFEGRSVRISCKGGQMEAEIENDGQVKVNMGAPVFTPDKIPFKAETEQLIYSLNIDDIELRVGALGVGNPHAVICVDDLDTVDIAVVGQAISTHPLFPNGVNVGFMQVTQPYQACLQVYERGVGETPACGSGACAAMVYGQKLGILDKEVNIIQPGGDLLISWSGGNAPIYMTGPAERVFQGHWLEPL